MDVREKLEVIAYLGDHISYKEDIGICYDSALAKVIEDAYMTLKNGVTVQDSKVVEIDQFNKWISVKEHLPQENEPEGATCEQVQVLLYNGVVSTGWCNRHTKMWWHLNHGETHFVGYDYEHTPVIAWQPLAQPPKGE